MRAAFGITGKSHHRHSDEEHRLQVSCVKWFRLAHARLSSRLFAVPNGGYRDSVSGARLKAEGVLAGVADLILLVRNGRYGALLVEMKTPTGRQSSAQKAWQADIASRGEYAYVICRSLDEFKNVVTDYLSSANL